MGERGERGRGNMGGRRRYDCMYCMYYTGCCNAPFIGVVEDDGMISGGDGGC